MVPFDMLGMVSHLANKYFVLVSFL